MRKITQLLLPLALVVSAALLAGCSGGEEDKGNVTDAAKPAGEAQAGSAGQPSGADAGKETRAGDYK